MTRSPHPHWSIRFAAGTALIVAACSPTTELTVAEKQIEIARMYSEYESDFPTVDGIDAAELMQRLSSSSTAEPASPTPDLLLIDVRPLEEREVSTLPDALPLEEFERRADDFADATLVTYCTVGYRSGLVAKDLQERGFEVLNLRGSLLSWTHAGGALVDDRGEETKRLHVYGERWDLAADDIETTW